METTFALLMVLCGLVGVFFSLRTFMIILTLFVLALAFGPVLYLYVQTGDGSLFWEAVFRLWLLGVAAYVTKTLRSLYRGHEPQS